MSEALVFRNKPSDFAPFVEVVGAFIECEGKYLHLKRAKGTLQEYTWCPPGGKVEDKEPLIKAVIRETFEEADVCLDENELQYIGPVYVRYSHLDFIYHIYHQKFVKLPKINLSKEHIEYRWLPFEEVFQLPLINGHEKVIRHFLTLSKKPALARKSFYFMRHGEIDIPEDLKAHEEIPLNQNGKKQSLLAQALVSNLPIKTACFSPLSRVVETKDILLQNLNVDEREIHDLKECSLDIWTQMMKLEKGSDFEVTKDLDAFMSQVIGGINQALKESHPPLIIAHGGVHWAMCYQMLIEDHPWKLDYCKLVHFKPVGKSGWEASIVG